MDYIEDDRRVIAVTIGDETIGYPLSILTFHEIINDRVADTPIAATY